MSNAPSRLERLRLGQWFAVTTGLLVAVAVIGLVIGLLALARLTEARELLADRLDPAAVSALRLNAAVIDEETGVRGFQLTGREDFLRPWFAGRREQAAARGELARFATGSADVDVLRRDLRAVDRAAGDWVDGYAQPTIVRVRRDGRVTPDDPSLAAGSERFDRFRASLRSLQRNLLAERTAARERLDDASDTARWALIGFAVAILLAVLAATATLRAAAIRPLGELAAGVRGVARGRFDESIAATGAKEVKQLGDDIESMRRRIVEEAAELQRSNAELEQFAYVASHDLQEPLRKVASFCQLLQQRYGGQLDDRADQYIDFAVDGAKRMQELINDLLAFSRVGRVTRELVEVDVAEVVRRAVADLDAAITDSGARVETGDLPTVQGDPGLLTLVFQNLIGNAVKFRGDAAPVVRIEARPVGECWEFTCTDNGIGISPEYADRIFVIFQRLHPRAAYEGTGIGLAMCRKIIEFHGGRIWLSSNGDGPGSTFRFTLPTQHEETTA